VDAGDRGSCTGEEAGDHSRVILPPVVGVEDRGTRAVQERGTERLEDEDGAVGREEGPAHHLPAPEVHDGTEEELLPLPRQLREVRDPDVAGEGRKDPKEEVRIPLREREPSVTEPPASPPVPVSRLLPEKLLNPDFQRPVLRGLPRHIV